jgi:hypothetical protein
MTLLVNLVGIAFVIAPFIGCWLLWKYFSSPEARHARAFEKLSSGISDALVTGDYNKAHTLAYGATVLARKLDPKAAEYEMPPAMQDLYDSMEDRP